MTEESAVKVCVRVRPLIAREESAESENAEPVHLFWKADKKSIHQIDDGNSTKSFSFDRVFTAEETTNQLYQNIAKPLVVSTVEGYNGTIFAYGQTSSGKTFTMMGSDLSPGVIPLAVEDVFQTIKNCPKKEFLLRVSYMEIYNETVTDLLVDSWKRKPLEVRETINKNIYVADLTEELVTSPAQALAWIRKGEKNRHYGKTKMNQRSSRSHTIFRMILESRERSDPASGENADGAIIVSHLNLVDLAGSERASQTGAEGTRFKEGCNINRSLFTLGQVIKKLTDESQKGFTNYRDSKLTRILQNSLGGNAKTVIIGTITPVALDETLSTLQFASTAKKMKNDPHVTEVSDDGALLKRYRNEIVDLKRRLQEVSSVTQTTATEKEVLSQLLQEKDQLQREQEDRIKNLTKLLVTSSNQAPVIKMPKRRVTWGGKMLRLARLSACDGGSSDHSFAEPFTRKRKASNVSLMELAEDDEDFDSHWEIPDEPTDDMEISQSSVTVRSFGDSPKDFVSPDRMHELSGKVSSLQLQLQTEVQQKQEALEKVAMLDLRVADLERRLEEQNNTPSQTDEQMRKQFAEAIQLCETLASEKDIVVAERDYLKQELGMFIEQIETLEKEKSALSKEMEEKREMDEFKSLEEEFRKEHEFQRLTEELESVQAERDGLLSEKESSCQTSAEEMEKLLCRVTSLSEEKDQLQEILEGLRQEKQQLRAELEDRMEMVAQVHCGFNQPEILTSEMHQQDEQVTHLQQETEQLQTTLQAVSEQKSQLETDLQRHMEMAAETQSPLHSLEQELQEQNQRNADLERLSQERQAQLEQQVAETQSLLHSLEEELQEQKQNNSDHMQLCEQKESEVEQQTKTLSEQLESVRAERDALLSERGASCETSTEEMEKLLCRVTSLSEERDQLQETLEGLRQEKQQLRAELEDRMETMQTEMRTLTEKLESIETERDSLLSEKESSCQTSTEEMEKLLCRVTSLSEERDQLQEILEGLRQEKQQLRAELEDRMETMQTEIAQLNMSLQTVTEQKRQVEYDLQQNMNMASTTQELLKSVQEELCEQKQMNSDLEKLCQEKECSLDQQMRTLTEKLESIEAERDSLLSEKESSCQTSTEEMEKLLCRVTSLSEERDQLQETLEGLRQEKQQLRAELEDRMEMISGIQERLSKQENLNSQQQPERGEEETKLQQRVQHLEEKLQTYRERHSHAQVEAETSQQLLSEAQTTISALKEQLCSLEQSTSGVKETASSRLQDSTRQLQESFRKFQHFIDTCSESDSTALYKVQCSLKHPNLASLPKPTMNAYSTVCQLQLQTTQSLGNIMEHLQVRAQGYKNLFEELVKKDLAVFEERRLQDVLLCRAQAPCYSVKDEDFHTLWHHRLTELLNKRQVYLQKMASILSMLRANMASYPSELSAEIRHRGRFKEQLEALLTKQPFSLSGLDSILSSELDHRSAVANSRKMILQGIVNEQNGLFEELKLLEAQADLQLREERSKSSTLLQALEGAPLKTELSLLKDNQQLVLQLQQTEEKIEALRVHNKQLEEAQIKANNRVSNHKQATQLLQTELQDTRAQVEEKDSAIQALRSKLRESEKNASPSAVELEKLRTKLFKKEVELSSATDNYKKEIQQMTTLLNQKEESVRKLKETLRKSQQEGEESFLQGEDLHARLTNPRGLVIKSSVLLEKTKLEEEVKQLQLKITELESLVSSQQVEINKWKNRAIKLKVKSKAEVDRPPSPCTPTKRGLPLTSDPSNFFSSPKKFLVTPRKVLDSPRKLVDSPRKLLDSPKVSVLDSPKSRFFDVGGSSEVLSRTCPKQFFDNSSLGTIPDAAAGAGRKEDWWPQSPKQEEMCKTQ